jgi:hypothetical protein
MLQGYQNLKGYNGSMYDGAIYDFAPRYDGLEFDYEVADTNVIGSPGGASSTQHHYTKGFYGQGGSSSDLYAGQGDRYISGEYGNMYYTGQSSLDAQQFQDSYTYSLPPDKIFANESSTTNIDHFNYPQNSQTPQKRDNQKSSVPTTNTDVLFDGNSSSAPSEKKYKIINPILIFIVIIFLYFALELWTMSGISFLQNKFHSGKEPSWQRLAIYALIVTVAVIAFTWYLDIPVLKLEQ